MTKINPEFSNEIKKYGGFDLNACFNCGNCTAICSLSTEDSSFPREMVRYSVLGLTDDIETTLGTDPLDSDTDADGLSDGNEDSNANGTVDASETNPLDPDTDNDGLNDASEVQSYQTNPLLIDTGKHFNKHNLLSRKAAICHLERM